MKSTISQITRAEIEGRFGLVVIPKDVFYKNPDEVIKAFKNCLIVRCEFRHDLQSFEYIAMSKSFDKIGQMVEPLKYEAEFEVVNIGSKINPYYEHKFKGFVKK